jgi:hypothetical protein
MTNYYMDMIDKTCFVNLLCLGNDDLTWRGGYGFFSKKIFWFPMLLKKYSDFGGGKKIIWFRVFVI